MEEKSQPKIVKKLVDHSTGLSAEYSELLETGRFSDVTLLIDGQRFDVHRLILARNSEYFQKLFYEKRFKEAHETEITLKETGVSSFEIILEYIYTGVIFDFDDMEVDLFEVLELSCRYGLKPLEEALIEVLTDKVSIDNWHLMIKTANLFDLTKLKDKCWETVGRDPQAFVASDTFIALSKEEILDFTASQRSMKLLMIERFQAIAKWLQANQNCGDLIRDSLLKSVDLTVLTNNQLIKVVAPAKLFDAEVILEFLSSRGHDTEEEKSTNTSAYKSPEVKRQHSVSAFDFRQYDTSYRPRISRRPKKI